MTQVDGGYRLGALPPGRYDYPRNWPGFSTIEVKDITLTVGRSSGVI